MNPNPCAECEDLISGKSNRRHASLERSGLSKSVGYHGNRDDEYFYTCRVCQTEFIGDSCGTWLAHD
jgi:hypothetical protein